VIALTHRSFCAKQYNNFSANTSAFTNVCNAFEIEFPTQCMNEWRFEGVWRHVCLSFHLSVTLVYCVVIVGPFIGSRRGTIFFLVSKILMTLQWFASTGLPQTNMRYRMLCDFRTLFQTFDKLMFRVYMRPTVQPHSEPCGACFDDAN